MGGIGTRAGMGETQIEVDRRLIRTKISKLKTKLKRIEQERTLQGINRKNEFRVALVGYTNAGKTTLFNKLTESMQLAEDKLFATLDSVTRKNKNPEHGPILFSDTVGFISDLPTQLIESFKATLDELKSGKVKKSDPDFKRKPTTKSDQNCLRFARPAEANRARPRRARASSSACAACCCCRASRPCSRPRPRRRSPRSSSRRAPCAHRSRAVC